MRRHFVAAISVACLMFPASGVAQGRLNAKSPIVEVSVQPLPAGTVVRPVAFARAAATLADEQRIGTYLWGAICIEEQPIYWKDVSSGIANVSQVFGEELKAAGFKPAVEPGSLFAEADNPAADLQVGALVRTAQAGVCDETLKVTTKIVLGVQWQVYSSLRREVVATIETSGAGQVAERVIGKRTEVSGRTVGQRAFAANVRALLADPQFRALVTAPDPTVQADLSSTASAPITLTGAARGAVTLEQAAGSVVAIFAGASLGSGFLVSEDGYILTNQHVVGTAATVRVRWSDGLETSGQVVRSDKRRDVALVKVEPRGRTALAVVRAIPPVGAQVYAIGTPLDPKLQNTVTRGIISATRIMDGFNFIQSDTPVTHGNSGGPLLNDKGAVVALTVSGRDPKEGSSLNFFIPIGDALDFLALKPAG